MSDGAVPWHNKKYRGVKAAANAESISCPILWRAGHAPIYHDSVAGQNWLYTTPAPTTLGISIRAYNGDQPMGLPLSQPP